MDHVHRACYPVLMDEQGTRMDEAPAERDGTDRPARLPSLSAAIRVARAEVADRAQALGDLRDAELARLELLREMLEPVLAQVPSGVDLFDTGLVPGEHPRLFIDMVCFVEMARDRRSYRLVQDRLHARTVLHEGEGVGAAVAAVTAYVARRLVEREQLLASMGRVPPPPPVPPPPAPRPRPAHALFRAARLAVDGLGVATLGAILWLGIHYAHGRLPGW
ncbi:hypothetical protein D3273_02620 [Lichenibacterium minor]|uniref:Uncharacterized protein n=1 Tax=Lichenibacterium minor TaxID=2316528 RepID=A0A4Q2UE52_9HYPH|nr:hypothetical protein [Lichenibacterium minor]RYC33386.1 hypothetical protein D3273_02620 [Lichenibacterium minor]